MVAAGGRATAPTASLTNTSNNRFWETLTQNIRDLLRETDKIIPEDQQGQRQPQRRWPGCCGRSSAPAAPAGLPPRRPCSCGAPARFRESASVIANPETGVISVRATYRQHMRVREFVDRVMKSAGRQVMIEATIVEVNLSDEYQQGINWSLFRRGLPLLQVGPAGSSMPSGVPVSGVIPSMADLHAHRATQRPACTAVVCGLAPAGVLWQHQGALQPQDQRHQQPGRHAQGHRGPGVLHADGQLHARQWSGSAPTFTITSTPNTVSVGLVMSVMPQVGEGDEVTLILRPTLSRVVSYVDDPAVPIYLAQARSDGINVSEISSRIPQIQTREMESVIKVRSGDTAVLGGLMRDDVSGNTDQTPGIGNVPGLGELFKYKNRSSGKSELVIFLRPTVVSSASLTGDHQSFEPHLSEALRPMPERMRPSRLEPEPLPEVGHEPPARRPAAQPEQGGRGALPVRPPTEEPIAAPERRHRRAPRPEPALRHLQPRRWSLRRPQRLPRGSAAVASAAPPICRRGSLHRLHRQRCASPPTGGHPAAGAPRAGHSAAARQAAQAMAPVAGTPSAAATRRRGAPHAWWGLLAGPACAGCAVLVWVADTGGTTQTCGPGGAGSAPVSQPAAVAVPAGADAASGARCSLVPSPGPAAAPPVAPDGRTRLPAPCQQAAAATAGDGGSPLASSDRRPRRRAGRRASRKCLRLLVQRPGWTPLGRSHRNRSCAARTPAASAADGTELQGPLLPPPPALPARPANWCAPQAQRQLQNAWTALRPGRCGARPGAVPAGAGRAA